MRTVHPPLVRGKQHDQGVKNRKGKKSRRKSRHADPQIVQGGPGRGQGDRSDTVTFPEEKALEWSFSFSLFNCLFLQKGEK